MPTTWSSEVAARRWRGRSKRPERTSRAGPADGRGRPGRRQPRLPEPDRQRGEVQPGAGAPEVVIGGTAERDGGACGCATTASRWSAKDAERVFRTFKRLHGDEGIRAPASAWRSAARSSSATAGGSSRAARAGRYPLHVHPSGGRQEPARPHGRRACCWSRTTRPTSGLRARRCGRPARTAAADGRGRRAGARVPAPRGRVRRRRRGRTSCLRPQPAAQGRPGCARRAARRSVARADPRSCSPSAAR